MTTTTDDDIRAIGAVIDTWREAAIAGDLARIFALYTDDLVAFDAIGPLAFNELAAYRTHWQQCLAMCPGLMVFEIRELCIEPVGDAALVHYLVRCGARRDDGSEQTGDMRASLFMRRTPGGWKIRHEHYSMPFDPTQCAPTTETSPCM